MLRSRNLSYDYKLRDDDGQVVGMLRALDSVDLEVKPGSFVAILGHNGSGKSTLAKQINAILQPTEGTLWVDGMDTADEEKIWEIRQTAGMVFQNPDNQIIGTVVEEDVGFGPENIGVPTKEIWQRVDEGLDAVDMQAFRKKSPNALSGGQKQRVAIAGILAMHPKCIVMDESTAMLDPLGRKEVLQAARRLNREEHITVIWITHYMEEVTEADYIYVMDSGRVVMEGTPLEVFSQEETLIGYGLDLPQMTRVAYELRKRGMELPAGILTREALVGRIKAYMDGRKQA